MFLYLPNHIHLLHRGGLAAAARLQRHGVGLRTFHVGGFLQAGSVRGRIEYPRADGRSFHNGPELVFTLKY